MPIYEYECPICGLITEQFNTIEDRHRNAPECCGITSKLIISKPANPYVSGYPYYDPILETEVTDPMHRKRLMKKYNLEERG